jgi:hypothetical protein
VNLLIKKKIGDVSGGASIFAGDSPARIHALRRVVGFALLAGIALSSSLWFPLTRSFPRAPLIITPPQSFVPPVEYLLGGLLVVALAALVFTKRTLKYLVATIVLLALLVLLDQTRLQPWVYQYLLLFAVIALYERQSRDEQFVVLTLSVLRLIVASLYVWSGVQKLNYTFGQEVLPQLLAPLQNHLQLTRTQLSVVGIGIALGEIFTGCGLLLKRTRELCVWLAVAIHGSVLMLLIWQGRNSIVWTWNVALVLIVIILFRHSDMSIRRAFAMRGADSTAVSVAQALAVACAVLPVLSFWGFWDAYLSGALYSGNTAVAVVRVEGEGYERLPDAAKRQVFATKKGERMLPLFEWAMSEMNVPPYPEPRVYRQIARQICKLVGDEAQVELIIKETPAIVSGSYKVTRMNCLQLGE